MSHDNAISQKVILQTPLFTVTECHYQGDGGTPRIQHDVKRLPTIAVFPITKELDVYLIKQYRQMYKTYLCESVAGFIDANETPLEAAKRELKEEAGITAETWQDVLGVDLAGSVIEAHSTIFIAKDLTLGTPQPDEDEEIELMTMSLDEAVKKVMTREIQTATSIIGILLLDQLRREGKL